jgi:glycosyltransferase involved in cell wall biosynthesis
MPAPETSPLPPVSVIMTALNEEQHLPDAVASVFAQDYPGPLELVVAVGPSRDRTRDVADGLAAAHERMTVVDNPTGRTPAGLNLAIAATDPASTVVVRTDGHAALPPGYVREAVEVLLRTGAANVGGMMIPEGVTAFERAVARAMATPLGLGPARFHVGGQEGPADSVYLGVFRRSILEKTGGFDEYFARAQDWELNHRIRRLGEVVWFDPRLQVRYRPRSNLSRLATQFRGSGAWRWQVVRVHPSTVNLRYLAAPVATAALAASGAVLLLDALVVHSAAVAAAAALPPVGYTAVVLAGSAATATGLERDARRWYPIVVAAIHLSWGTGFLLAMADDLTREPRRRLRDWWAKHGTARNTAAGLRAGLDDGSA